MKGQAISDIAAECLIKYLLKDSVVGQYDKLIGMGISRMSTIKDKL